MPIFPLRAPLGRARSLLAGTIGLSLILAGSLTLISPASAAPATLLSAGKPVTVSSTQAPHLAANLTDGDPQTRWASETGEGAWAEISLGAACTLDRLELTWEAAYARQYRVEGRVDGVLTTLKEVTAGTGGTESVTGLIDASNVSAVRLTSIERALPHGISLFEMGVFGSECVDLPEVPETPGDPELGTLISRGAKALASSVENPAHAPGNATREDPTLRWSSAATDNEWIMLDLGARYSVSAVAIDWETSYATDYRIDTSRNGWDWDTLSTVTGSDGKTDVIRASTAATDVRFIRMSALVRSSQFGVSMWEFRVYGDDREELPTAYDEGKTPGTELLSYQKPGTASSSQNDIRCVECTPDKMFDQDMGSRWAVAEEDWSDDAWVMVDLGAPAVVSQVSLRWDPAFATAYRLDIASEADGPWTQVYGTIGGTGNKDIITLEPTAGRFLRLTMQERAVVWGNKYGYSIAEFRVYGTGGDPVTPPAGATDPDFDNLELVWSDEFNEPAGSAAHPDRWVMDNTARAGDNNNAELQLYTANTNNVRHDGEGNLIVEAKVDDLHGAKVYTSGRLNTSGLLHAQYGRFEARVKVPEGRGLWPAFWMMGSSFLEGRPWPANGEIDIMEVLGHEPSVSHSTIHGPGYSGMGGQGQSFTLPSQANLAEDFHVWSADWDSTGIRFALDGIPTFEITKDYVENTLNQPWVYDQEFYLILNLAVGGDWPGSPNAETQFPAQMLVDYVRVYQSADSGSLTGGQGTPITAPIGSGNTPGAGAGQDAAAGAAAPAARPGTPATGILGETGFNADLGWARALSLLLILGGAAVLLRQRLTRRVADPS